MCVRERATEKERTRARERTREIEKERERARERASERVRAREREIERGREGEREIEEEERCILAAHADGHGVARHDLEMLGRDRVAHLN